MLQKEMVKMNMDNYVETMIKELPIKIIQSNTDITPTENNVFWKYNSKRLVKRETKYFLDSVAR